MYICMVPPPPRVIHQFGCKSCLLRSSVRFIDMVQGLRFRVLGPPKLQTLSPESQFSRFPGPGRMPKHPELRA